jgi:hypothetical protein
MKSPEGMADPLSLTNCAGCLHLEWLKIGSYGMSTLSVETMRNYRRS